MNIYPREVEEALLRHPGVDGRRRRRPARPGVGRGGGRLRRGRRRRRPTAGRRARPDVPRPHRRYKRPKDYRFVDALPTNNYGKVVKRELRDQLRAEAEDRGRAEHRVTCSLSPEAGSGGPESVPLDLSVGRRVSTSPTVRRPSLMKLALYLPNFRDKVTVKELEDLTSLAEELDFDSVWTLDRIVVPEASDREELQYSFGMMEEFPKALPVSSRGEWFQGWPLIPWLAAKTTKVRIGMSITDTPYRAPGVLAAEIATSRPPLERPAQRGRRVRLDARGVRGRERLAHLPQAAQARARDDRDHAGHLDERPLRVPRRVRRLRPVRVRRQAACRSRTRRSSSAGSRTRSARRAASRSTACRAGSASRTRRTSSAQWRGAIQRELEELGSSRSIDDLEICSMIWFVITDEETDQTPQGKVSNLLAGTAGQITDNLKRYKEAGLTMPLLWPPFADVPVAKTLDDLKRLKEEIMPKVDAM